MNTKMALLTPLVIFSGLLSCKTDSVHSEDSLTRLPREQTLYVGGFKWSPPQSFNRLAAEPGFGIDHNMQVIYESLFGYDQRTGELVPILGRSYKQKDSAIEVILDKRAFWNDGNPVSCEDIKYTFELDKRYPTPRQGNWKYLSGIEITSDSTLSFGIRADTYNPFAILDMLSEVSILPQRVYEKLEKDCWVDSLKRADYMRMLQFKNDSIIIGSGPYTLYSYSDDRVILKRVDSYWGTVKYNGQLPGPTFIVHSLYKSNSHFNAAMKKGLLDCSSNYMPRVWDNASDKIRAWNKNAPYHLPGCIPTLFMAMNREPFKDVAFRRALIHSIDFNKIAKLAFSEYSPPLQPGLILPFGFEAQYYSEDDAKTYGYCFDIDKARAILAAGGYSWKGGMLRGPDGTIIRTLTVECPVGWSDWENTLRIAIDGFRALGLSVHERFIDFGLWDQNAKKGTFDLLMRTTTSEQWPSTPWRRFQQLLSSENFRPVGQEMTENFGRYRNAEVDSLLRIIPRKKTSSELQTLYRHLNVLFMKEIPVLPLMYRPAVFYQFSEKHWKNFPTQENPYAPPQMLMIGAGIRGLWGIKPVREDL